MSDHIKVFADLYENCSWGNNSNTDYKGSSGNGSDVEYNITTYIPFLREFLKKFNITTVVDLGCGDFRCGKFIYDDMKDIKYYGYDAYDKIIKHHNNSGYDSRYQFTHLDFYKCKEEIMPADLCILKDVLQHWKLEEIYIFMDYLIASKKYKYILICNCGAQTTNNTDISTGQCRALSSQLFPLKKYNPIIMYRYYTKEVSIVICPQ